MRFPFTICSLTEAQRSTCVPGISFAPGIQKAFADGTMDKKDLIRKRKKLGWKVSE